MLSTHIGANAIFGLLLLKKSIRTLPGWHEVRAQRVCGWRRQANPRHFSRHDRDSGKTDSGHCHPGGVGQRSLRPQMKMCSWPESLKWRIRVCRHHAALGMGEAAHAGVDVPTTPPAAPRHRRTAPQRIRSMRRPHPPPGRTPQRPAPHRRSAQPAARPCLRSTGALAPGARPATSPRSWWARKTAPPPARRQPERECCRPAAEAAWLRPSPHRPAATDDAMAFAA